MDLTCLDVEAGDKSGVGQNIARQNHALATNTGGFSGRVKHLLANKLEVTVLMRRD